MADRTAPYPAYNYLGRSQEPKKSRPAARRFLRRERARTPKFTFPIIAMETKQSARSQDRRFVYGGEGDCKRAS